MTRLAGAPDNSYPDPVAPTPNEHGFEEHPAWGSIDASRGTVGGAGGGAILFDSDVKHNHTIRVRIHYMERKRDLKHDWLHPRKEIIEVEMSEAQWASFVSSPNTGGVPCTIRWKENEGHIPGILDTPRLAESMAEVRGAAEEAFGSIKDAMDALEALPPNAGVKARREAMSRLHHAIANAPKNVEWTGKVLTEHVENVVQRARADIEVMARNAQPGTAIEADTSALAIEGGREE
jgi:hypothetical protein